MARDFKQILHLLLSKIKKSPTLLNTTSLVGNVTVETQHKLTNIFNKTVKQLKDSTIVQNINAAALEPSSTLPKRLVNYWQWYQQLVGLDKVEIAKKHVIIIQNALFECQNQRRNLTHQISLINAKLKDIYSELIQTKRDDPKYVQLTILENKSLQEHTKTMEELSILEKQEHDMFIQLTTSIKEYHDCQLLNSQKYKYLSILASAFIGFASLTASIIYNNKRLSDMKNSITNAEKSMNTTFKSEIFKIILGNQEQITSNKNNDFEETKINYYHPVDAYFVLRIIELGTLLCILYQVMGR